MWKAFFGDVANGRLKRLEYLGYAVLLNLVVIASVIGGIMLLGGMERMNGDPAAMQQWMIEHMGGFGMLVFALLMFVFLFAGLNLMAKRLRDMGLPGWPGVLGVMVISLLVASLLGGGAAPDIGTPPAINPVNNLIQLAILLFLLLVPSNAFGKRD